jgi:hypothetical protein
MNPKLNIHADIQRKLDGFLTSRRIPHILFHGTSGSGKKTIVMDFVNKIYNQDKKLVKRNVMFVNCAHGKGIKFIRDELKFFAKSNVQGSKGILFKTIILLNADSLTVDAQSAMRRCIELFSYNTRFFIIVDNKQKLLNPILSRFCEIYISDTLLPDGTVLNLHRYNLDMVYGVGDTPTTPFSDRILKGITVGGVVGDISPTDISPTDISLTTKCIQMASDAYEQGLSCLDLIEWIRHCEIDDKKRYNIIMRFHEIKSEYRHEKLLMLTILNMLYSDS